MTDHEHTQLKECAAVIAAFGGIRPMAHKVGVPVSTVQGWKQRNAIPENRIADIVAAAEAHNVDLADIVGAAEAPAPSPEPVAEAPTDTPGPAQPPGDTRRPGGQAALIMAAIALVVALAAGAWSVFGDRQRAASTDLTAITKRLAALEAVPRPRDTADLERRFADDVAELRAALDRVASKQEEIGTLRADIASLIGRLEKTETELDRLQQQATDNAATAAAALSAAQDDEALKAAKADIAQLRDRLAALGEARSAAGKNVAGAVGLALATGRLQRAIDAGDAYQDTLASLRALSAGDAAIGAVLDRLAAHAASGVPRHNALQRAFPGTARNIATAADAEAAGGWAERTLQRIRNTVSIRRVGADVPGDTPGARVARAEAKLNGGDLAGAIAELDGLTGAAAKAAAAWLADARTRRDAVTAAGELEALAIARLQAGAGGS